MQAIAEENGAIAIVMQHRDSRSTEGPIVAVSDDAGGGGRIGSLQDKLDAAAIVVTAKQHMQVSLKAASEALLATMQ